MEKRLIVGLFILFLPDFGLSQVTNNDIENRIALSIDAAPFSSRTTDCTVQWACVDQSLTGKCIQYHNDQWFWFNTQEKSRYFINISGQQCRDLRGVQLVVIEGVPCDPSSYQILNCTSLATQDDIFVMIDSLKPYHDYLLNIDGYLNDHCEFSIQVSNTPKGLPLDFIEVPIPVDASKEDRYVTLQWEVNESQASQLTEYVVFRKHGNDARFEPSFTVPHEKNAFGISTLSYSAVDTLTEYGQYYYKIVGVTPENDRLLLGSHAILHRAQTPSVINNYLTFAIPCEAGQSFTVKVYNGQTKELLISEEIQCLQNEYVWKYPFSFHIPYYKILMVKANGQEKEFIYYHE